MILRLCLKDKSSVLIKGDIEDINTQLKYGDFIEVINVKSGKEELYNKDYIWCIRESSQQS